MKKRENRREWVRFLVILATPFILIFGGAGLAALGLQFQNMTLLIAGGLVFLAGILWCLWVVLIQGGGFWWD